MVHVKLCTCIRKHEHTAVHRDTKKLKHVQTFVTFHVLGFTPSAFGQSLSFVKPLPMKDTKG